MIKVLLLIVSLAFANCLSRSKRAAYDLPDGVELIVGSVKTTFNCAGNGYYADVDNNCQIFHICQDVAIPGEPSQLEQWSFMCGNQTVFNQLTFTCAYPEEAIPCASSRDFFYLNDNIGVEKAPFLREEDIERGVRLYPASTGQVVPRPGGGGGGRPGAPRG